MTKREAGYWSWLILSLGGVFFGAYGATYIFDTGGLVMWLGALSLVGAVACIASFFLAVAVLHEHYDPRPRQRIAAHRANAGLERLKHTRRSHTSSVTMIDTRLGRPGPMKKG